MTVGEFIKQELERQGMTKYRLAKLTGIANQHLYNIESGKVKHPRFDYIGAIAEALNLSLDEIYKATKE